MTDTKPPIAALVDAFGGVKPLADALGAPYSTVHTWTRLGIIPRWRWTDIREAARERGITLPADARAA